MSPVVDVGAGCCFLETRYQEILSFRQNVCQGLLFMLPFSAINFAFCRYVQSRIATHPEWTTY